MKLAATSAEVKVAYEQRLKASIADGESITASGTLHEESHLGNELTSGNAWTFALLTSARILFGRWVRPDEDHEEIALDGITGWAEVIQYHRCAIALTHPPMTRQERVPAHNFLWFHWGDASAAVTRTQTIFRFNHRDAELAQALRAELHGRGIAGGETRLDETPRSERSGAVELRPQRRYHRKPRWARR